MTIARVGVMVVVVSAIALARPVRAQSVEAELLFREGRKLMKDGQIGAACDKFEASARVESSTGTLLNLADCREKNAQLASAWVTFRKAAAVASSMSDPKREAEARRRATALEPRLSHLTIAVPQASQIADLQIARNGAPVDRALWNQGVPVDPGDYEIVGQAPGHEHWSAKIKVIGERQQVSVDVPTLEMSKPVAVEVKTTPEPIAPPIAVSTRTSVEPASRSSALTGIRMAALGVAAVGVVGIAGGAVFGTKANNLERQSNGICPTATCNDAHALSLNSDAKHDALVANIGFVGAGAAVATAAVLWFIGAPTHASEHVSMAPIVARDVIGLSLGGAF